MVWKISATVRWSGADGLGFGAAFGCVCGWLPPLPSWYATLAVSSSARTAMTTVITRCRFAALFGRAAAGSPGGRSVGVGASASNWRWGLLGPASILRD